MAEALPTPPGEKPAPKPRTYRVEHHIDHRPGCPWHWRLYTYGRGHWCVGNGHAGSFQSETEAHREGRRWVETGKGPTP